MRRRRQDVDTTGGGVPASFTVRGSLTSAACEAVKWKGDAKFRSGGGGLIREGRRETGHRRCDLKVDADQGTQGVKRKR